MTAETKNQTDPAQAAFEEAAQRNMAIVSIKRRLAEANADFSQALPYWQHGICDRLREGLDGPNPFIPPELRSRVRDLVRNIELLEAELAGATAAIKAHLAVTNSPKETHV